MVRLDRLFINVDLINVDKCSTVTLVSRYVRAGEAARLLGVQKATLYAYVSRGLVSRTVAIDGRTSLYALDDIESLAARSRRHESEPPPSLDVQIVTGVTTLDESGPRYRGHDAADLSRTCSFEQVAELLWTGALPATVEWPEPDPADVALAHAVSRAVDGGNGVPAMVAVASAFGAHHPADDPPGAARRLLGVVATVLGGPSVAGGVATRLAVCWGSPGPLAAALDRTLVLLADHELATSTLAVRITGSTWTGPYPAFAAGLATVQGALHGGAARQVHDLLVECEEIGAPAAVARRLHARERLPGFGHKIYQGEDPRLAPLLEAVALLPDPNGRNDVVEDLRVETSNRLMRRPNVDLGVGALSFVGGLPADVPLFAVARLAGFAAHLDEELQERPLRYRGLARPPRP
jgi:citrate synthase